MENLSEIKKRPSISLTDFFNRKLKKTSHQSKLVQGKDNLFLSPGTSVGTNQSIDGAKADKKTKGPELNRILDVALEQFNRSKENGGNTCLNLEDENETSTTTSQVTQESQIQDFGGLYGNRLAPKGLVVLSGDPKPKQSKYEKPLIEGEKHCLFTTTMQVAVDVGTAIWKVLIRKWDSMRRGRVWAQLQWEDLIGINITANPIR